MNYLDLMSNFSISTLQKILGNEIVENLDEWNYSQEDKWSKKKLVSMIDCLYGINILKNSFVREQLLLAMGKNDVIDLVHKYFPNNSEGDLKKVCKILSEKQWGNNSFSLKLLHLWGN